MNQQNQEKDAEEGNMKEAVLAIIGSTLIDEQQLKGIKNIFKIMDSTGDGKIANEELTFGFE